jgi:hypothetical protein
LGWAATCRHRAALAQVQLHHRRHLGRHLVHPSTLLGQFGHPSVVGRLTLSLVALLILTALLFEAVDELLHLGLLVGRQLGH